MIAFMLNLRQKIITQVAAIILICIIPLTSVASHEHAPHEAQECTDCAAPVPSTCCCKNAADCHQQSDHDNAQPHHKCHCYGFHTLQSILPGLDIQYILLQQPFYTPEFHIAISQLIQNIFQPPKN